ncbi:MULTISPECIES: carbamate kinase [Lactobacillales]|uniref:Carbamate kinase n=1 Tax=Jeotgalibaca ciconiae TaxID=2496265 RepID=A0A3Q9BJM4_9LACT|nr:MULTISPECIES: carbamate kinase [Lactobacillales]MDY5177618.1 carbamate kinase [Lactococcus lactis]HJB22810.1 carbamate kinase [Candidatus Jeotgalibaca pullicola]AZP03907.1 carbamate kinase [Jeotgalibaca ciconiae]MUN72411.1 carbamate kinase [Enterococcus faecium]OHY82490.1 carbamate kinase [Enterococcus faecium]
MPKKIVVALGGNAILTDIPTAEAQKESLRQTSEHLVSFVKEGHQIMITHGNGPQVGNLLLQHAAADSEKNPAFPLDSLVAMTQGSIGFWMQNALREALIAHNIEKPVVSLVTQVQVDENDPAFENPSKPIGPFLSEEEAKVEMKKGNGTFIEDAGRGWRKVVPSPKPKSILEYPIVESLTDNGVITIAAGGGGIPVIASEEGFTGIEAVIDKDFAAAKLAELVGADYLIILTGVDNVYVNWNKPDQKKLTDVTVDELKEYIKQNQFAPGSMLPKVEAAIEFVENAKDGKAIITSLENAGKLFDGNGDVTTVIK